MTKHIKTQGVKTHKDNKRNWENDKKATTNSIIDAISAASNSKWQKHIYIHIITYTTL